MFDFSGFISALFNKKDKGVHNLQSATKMVEELPESELQEALLQINKALVVLNRNTAISLKERIRTVCYLDEKARTIQQQLCREYLASLENPMLRGKAYLNTILDYWHAISSAYKTCLRQYQPKLHKSLSTAIQLICARGISIVGEELRWHHIRYLKIEGKLWRSLHRLYFFAETNHFSQQQIQIYADDVNTNTIQNIYFVSLMLHLSRPDNMSIQQINLVHVWLKQGVKSLNFETEVRPQEQAFAVHLSEPMGPRKVRRNMIHSNYRYWRTDSLLEQLQIDLHELQQEHIPLCLHELQTSISPSEIAMILRLAALRWNKETALIVRKHDRMKLEQPISVSKGFKKILQLVIQQNSKMNEDNIIMELSQKASPTLESHMSQWMMQDQSESGIGVSYQGSLHDHLHIRTLIGFTTADQASLAIGIVRRLFRTGEGDVSVGIETIAKKFFHVAFGAEGAEQWSDAVLLPQIDDSMPHTLLLPLAHYANGQCYWLTIGQARYWIKLGEACELGSDFARVPFSLLAKE